MIDRTTDILGLVDVQPTFMPGGELAVADGASVVRAPRTRIVSRRGGSLQRPANPRKIPDAHVFTHERTQAYATTCAPG